MTTYNTGNAIGSADPRDLYDNAQVVDEYANSDNATTSDRLGNSRKTLSGMNSEYEADKEARDSEFDADQQSRSDEFDADQEDRNQRFDTFIASSGYEFVGDYESGIELTEYNQVVRDTNGEFWRVSGSQSLPYTATGAGLPEGGAFVTVGDAALRQELDGDVANGQGARLVRGAVIYVDTVADLQALDTSGLAEGQQAKVKDEGDYVFTDGAWRQQIRYWADNLFGATPSGLWPWLEYLQRNGFEEPPREFLRVLGQAVGGLQEAGVWEKVDMFYVLGGYQKDVALLNVKNPELYPGVPNNENTAEGFISYHGWQGNGHDSVITFDGSDPNIADLSYKVDNAHTFIACGSGESSSGYAFGASGSFNRAIRLNRANNTFTVRANDGTNTTHPTFNNSSFGVTGFSRQSGDQYISYKNGHLTRESNFSTTSFGSGDFVLFQASSGTIGFNVITAVSVGSGISRGEALQLSTILDELMLNLGIEEDLTIPDVDPIEDETEE